MKTFVSHFFSTDIRVRAAVIMALVLIVFWWGLGKVIVRLASFLPYLLRIVFKRIYLLIEVPVCWIHDRAGSFFHDIDNGLARGGDKIDTFFGRWYACWRDPKSRHIFLSVVIYCALLIWICIPYNADARSFSGQPAYLSLEGKLTHWLETHDLYAAYTEEVMSHDEPESIEDNIAESIVMKVITQKDPLSVRDIPATENCEILERVEKESTVLWKGDLAFGSGSNGIEPWARVETPEGTIGWARLMYLCPANEKDYELMLRMVGEKGD